MIVVLPKLAPVINPELFTVATMVSEDTQGFVVAAVALPIN